MFTTVVTALLVSSLVAAVPCTQTQKQTMLSAITTDPQWAACQKATAPYDFYKSLTQVNQPPTATQVAAFEASPACKAVYTDFQAALKAANCDEIQNMLGLGVAPFVQLTTPTAAPSATPAEAASGAPVTTPPVGPPASVTPTGAPMAATGGSVPLPMATEVPNSAATAMQWLPVVTVVGGFLVL
ncbi:hypothetical protein ACHHYP_08871 [Achlya hypogyna]|uniref:Elicitin n=1 Tax=Achlya hypogyna TaxID=1202772 RepID=A0A1V9YP20_ACHHY|nr:hypothetical protein ACHHYP_08871 [Achlya hypogyna]